MTTPAPHDDAELAKHVLAGDTVALEILFREHCPLLSRFAVSMLV